MHGRQPVAAAAADDRRKEQQRQQEQQPCWRVSGLLLSMWLWEAWTLWQPRQQLQRHWMPLYTQRHCHASLRDRMVQAAWWLHLVAAIARLQQALMLHVSQQQVLFIWQGHHTLLLQGEV